MGNTAVVVPAQITMTSRGGVYELQGITAKFSKNGVNVCACILAVGRDENGDVVNVGFERGDEAFVSLYNARPEEQSIGVSGGGTGYQVLTSGAFTLFRGVIDDFGPAALDFGSFGVQVILRGEAAYLSSGTFGTSNITTKSYLDTNVAPSFAQGAADNSQMDVDSASVQLWPEMQRTFINIATQGVSINDSVTAQIINTFGTDINAVAASALADIEGRLLWNSSAGTVAPGIILNMNQMLTREWFYESFLHRLIAYGEMLRFSVLETTRGVTVVPYVPFFLSTNAYVINSNTYSSVRWKYGPYSLYSGALLVAGTGQEALNAQGGSGLVVGSFKLRGNPLGMVHVGVAPPYLTTAETTIITGAGSGARSLKPAGRAVGDSLAKYLAWELNYGQRSIEVTCPFVRSDIGPLQAVRVDFPGTAEIQAGVETPAVYGSVQSVQIQVDAQKRTASTTYSIGFVRSYLQQKQQIDRDISAGEHPFFSTNYIGGRLDTGQPDTPSGQVDGTFGGFP